MIVLEHVFEPDSHLNWSLAGGGWEKGSVHGRVSCCRVTGQPFKLPVPCIIVAAVLQSQGLGVFADGCVDGE